jgi:hypothetical protein
VLEGRALFSKVRFKILKQFAPLAMTFVRQSVVDAMGDFVAMGVANKKLESRHKIDHNKHLAMIEPFNLQENQQSIETAWRQKTLMSAEILGRAAKHLMRPEVIHDRSRLDLMWCESALGVRGPTNTAGRFEFVKVSKIDTVNSGIERMIEVLQTRPPPLQLSQLRFRHNLSTSKSGLWIDTSNEQIKALIDEGDWLRFFLGLGWTIEAGQKHKEFVLCDDGRLSFEPAKTQCWLASYDHNNNEIPIESLVSLFSQPGPEANRALLAAGFDLLSDQLIPETWGFAEWGAGSGNLTAAFASHFKGQSIASELEAAAAECLKSNCERFFTHVRSDCKAAEVGFTNPLETKVDLWILDPPRPGFGRLLTHLDSLTKKPAAILIYHCHNKGLITDSLLLKNMRYKLVDWISVDIFPATPHHEVVSLWIL